MRRRRTIPPVLRAADKAVWFPAEVFLFVACAVLVLLYLAIFAITRQE